MEGNEQVPTLERLDDTELTLANPEEDIRGRTVLDNGGEEIGKVDSLYIDVDERRVRFLEISSGGLLGMGASKQLVPVDVVSSVGEDSVQIDKSRDHVAKSPGYDPDLVRREPAYFADLYGYYGAAPFWGPGYRYPPMIPRR